MSLLQVLRSFLESERFDVGQTDEFAIVFDDCFSEFVINNVKSGLISVSAGEGVKLFFQKGESFPVAFEH